MIESSFLHLVLLFILFSFLIGFLVVGKPFRVRRISFGHDPYLVLVRRIASPFQAAKQLLSTTTQGNVPF